MVTLYKRNAQDKPLIWKGWSETILNDNKDEYIVVEYGLVGGQLHREMIKVTKSKVNELQSRVNAKRKEGYKELSELKDGVTSIDNLGSDYDLDKNALYNFLNTYLPKYSTTSEGFVLPMLAKVLEDNKPFEKFGTLLGQWKIDGLRCLIGAERNDFDLFEPIILTYHSRTGENWTSKMKWMTEIILPKIDGDLLDLMIEEGAYLDGELYLPGYSVNDINSFVKNPQLKQHYLLQYWCYDIACENMSAEARSTFRYNNIHTSRPIFINKEDHLNNKKQLVLLPTVSVDDIQSAVYNRDIFIKLGFEGLIVRNPNAEYQFGKRNQAMHKFKKVDDGKFIIVDIKSEHKRSDLPLFVLRNDINDELFECSINKPQDVQREILINKDNYVGKYMLVEFRSRSGIAQVPFHARGIDIKD